MDEDEGNADLGKIVNLMQSVEFQKYYVQVVDQVH